MSNQQVTISVACDGFTVTLDGEAHWINQEDDPSVELKKVFEKLGCEVKVEEDY